MVQFNLRCFFFYWLIASEDQSISPSLPFSTSAYCNSPWNRSLYRCERSRCSGCLLNYSWYFKPSDMYTRMRFISRRLTYWPEHDVLQTTEKITYSWPIALINGRRESRIQFQLWDTSYMQLLAGSAPQQRLTKPENQFSPFGSMP